MNYHPRSLGEFGGWHTLWACEICGALVVQPEQEVHPDWHEEIKT